LWGRGAAIDDWLGGVKGCGFGIPSETLGEWSGSVSTTWTSPNDCPSKSCPNTVHQGVLLDSMYAKKANIQIEEEKDFVPNQALIFGR
jgi:hypothetical protein